MFRYGFAIGNLRRAGAGVHLELAKEAVTDNFQVQLTHPGNDELAGFFIGEAAEGRIFFGQTLQTFGHLLPIGLCFRLDGHGNDRLREGRRFEHDVEILIAKRVAGGDVP